MTVRSCIQTTMLTKKTKFMAVIKNKNIKLFSHQMFPRPKKLYNKQNYLEIINRIHFFIIFFIVGNSNGFSVQNSCQNNVIYTRKSSQIFQSQFRSAGMPKEFQRSAICYRRQKKSVDTKFIRIPSRINFFEKCRWYLLNENLNYD